MEQLVNFIIRPPRAVYNPDDDLLDQEFQLKGKWYQRKDMEITNSRGDTLRCSRYFPSGCHEEKPLPCVIYCYANSGCRADASAAAIILLPSNITVFTLDFSGPVLSGGQHVTLEWNEIWQALPLHDQNTFYTGQKDDLKTVVEYLRADGNVSMIGLWGQSMGAVTSLMYGTEDPSIAGRVLDSPFSDLVDLTMELADTYKFRIPKFTVKLAIQYMRKAILKKVAKSCFVCLLIGHATDDDFIHPHHSDRIYEVYMGPSSSMHELGYRYDCIASSKGMIGNIFSPSCKQHRRRHNQIHSRRPVSRIQDEGTNSIRTPSSPELISFDDNYVDSPLDALSDAPCDTEEEKRMLMEAIQMSLEEAITSFNTNSSASSKTVNGQNLASQDEAPTATEPGRTTQKPN